MGGEPLDGLQTEGERRAEKEIYRQCILTWVESCQMVFRQRGREKQRKRDRNSVS